MKSNRNSSLDEFIESSHFSRWPLTVNRQIFPQPWLECQEQIHQLSVYTEYLQDPITTQNSRERSSCLTAGKHLLKISFQLFAFDHGSFRERKSRISLIATWVTISTSFWRLNMLQFSFVCYSFLLFFFFVFCVIVSVLEVCFRIRLCSFQVCFFILQHKTCCFHMIQISAGVTEFVWN